MSIRDALRAAITVEQQIVYQQHDGRIEQMIGSDQLHAVCEHAQSRLLVLKEALSKLAGA